VTREELITKLWPADTFVDFEHSLNKAVKRLREALQDSADEPRFIETLPRRGYRFIAPVLGDGAKRPAAATATENAPSVRPGAFRRNSKAIILLLFGGAVALATLGYRGVGVSRGRVPDFQKMKITRLTDNGQVAQVAISPDGRYVAYERLRGEEVSVWLQQVATRSEVQILRPGAYYILGLTFSPDGNYLYFVSNDKDDPFLHHLYMIPTLGGPARRLLTDVDTPVSFSPDGREFVFTRGDPSRTVVEVRIANADGSNERLLATMKDSSSDDRAAAGATWSPDGRTICVPLRRKQRPGVLEMVSVADGSAREFYVSPWHVGRPLWQPEGDALVVELEDHTGRGQLWALPFPHGEPRRLTNDLFDYAKETDMTRNGKTVASRATTQISNIWMAPTSDLSSTKQITSGNLAMIEVAGSTDGKLLSVSAEAEPWIMNSDGSQRAPFSSAHNVAAITACGRFVVFLSNQAATDTLVRVDTDGSNPVELVRGTLGRGPSCSPDGAFVYYLNLEQPRKISRVPVEGGTPVDIAKPLGDGSFGRVSISRDGRLLAYSFDEGIAEPTTRLAVIPVTGGAPVRLIKGLAGLVRWSPDGTGLDYLETRDQATNVWEQPLAGGVPKQLTHFASERIFNFNWSPDGKRLLVTRGNFSSDVVLISNFR